MRVCLLITFALIEAVSLFSSPRPALERPNVVILFLDDCGYGDFSHTGNPSIHTPNISQLVSEGLNFPQFYTASPACSASRYALLTGRNPARSGFNWVLGPEAEKHIHTKEITLAEGLKSAGYSTAMFGKWHLGNPNEANGFTSNALPLAHGFDYWIGSNVSNDYDPGANLIRSKAGGTSPAPGYEIIEKNYARNQELQGSLTARYTDEAMSFIRNNLDTPFFAYVAYGMPHLPVHASRDAIGKSKRGLYGDVIEEIDANVGRLRSLLDELELAENTLIVFTSDNGPWIRFQETAEHEMYGEARLNIGSALPFRDGKGSTWEGGVRVPGVFWWPGVIEPATVVREPACTFDVLPTVFAYAAVPIPTDRSLDGRDIRHYLNRALYSEKVDDFRFIYTGASRNEVYGVRRGPWKAHVRLYSQTKSDYGFQANRENPLLFQLEHDPSERFDRANERPDIIKTLMSEIDHFESHLSSEGTFWQERP